MTLTRQRQRVGQAAATPPATLQARVQAGLRIAMEVVLLVLVAWAPWPLASVRPVFEYYLYLGVGVLAALWAARILVAWQFSWQKCPVVVGLGLLLLYGIWQLTPLPGGVLAFLSPATTNLVGFFAAAAEPAIQTPVGQEAGNTISVYPEGTRADLVRLVAVLLVFAVVRNNLASPAHLSRLSYVVAANGMLLALFALVQFFSAPHGTLFWKYPTVGGVVFGPFMNRGHFAFYLNLCIGLTCGLLLSSRVFAEGRRRALQRDERRKRFSADDGRPPGPAQVLQDGHAVWMLFALALMVGTIFFSLSRAGILSLLTALTLGVVVQAVRYRRLPRASLILCLAGLTLALLGWLGLNPIQNRLATLWRSDTYQGGRLQLWKDNLGLVAQFPLWGTGLGTYAYVEPLERSRWLQASIQAEHADNDYVEALVEGGLVRSLLSLFLIALVYRLGWHALRRFAGGSTEGLILGALLAFTTCVFQAGLDFGLHLPAIALLVTVIAAQIASLGAEESPYATRAAAAGLNGSAGAYRLRMGGLAPLAAAATVVILSLVVIGQGRAAERADRYRLAALRVLRTGDADVWDRQIALLGQSVQLRPGDANLHVDLADAYYNRFKKRRDEAAASTVREDDPMSAVADWLAIEALAGRAGLPSGLLAATEVASRPLLPQSSGSAAQTDLVQALNHYHLAQRLNPLHPKPHVRMAVHAGLMGEQDQQTGLARAKRLLRNDPELWYFAGVQDLKDGRPGDALASWRQSLTHADRFLADVLDQSLKAMPADAVANQLFPDEPGLLIKAAEQLSARGQEALGRTLLARAATILAARPRPTPQEYYDRAQIELALDQPEEAMRAYDKALLGLPRQTVWRLEYARLLHREGKLREARRELSILLGLEPGNTQARDLLEGVSREIAEKL